MPVTVSNPKKLIKTKKKKFSSWRYYKLQTIKILQRVFDYSTAFHMLLTAPKGKRQSCEERERERVQSCYQRGWQGISTNFMWIVRRFCYVCRRRCLISQGWYALIVSTPYKYENRGAWVWKGILEITWSWVGCSRSPDNDVQKM
jgi:hypothetical protein